MVNNQTSCIIVKVIGDCDYIYNVIDYYYIASGKGNYNSLRSCNQLQSIIFTNYNYTLPDVTMMIAVLWPLLCT